MLKVNTRAKGGSTCTFSSSCLDVGQKGEGGWRGSKAVSHQISKIESHYYSSIIFIRPPGNLVLATLV